jgi:hypothetical protein
MSFSVLTHLACALALAVLLSGAGFAQEDPNAQHITLQSGALVAETREIAVPVEVGALRVFFNLQLGEGITWTILTPTGRPLVLSEPNISVTETKDKRTVAMWDPRPGLWKLRLEGTGQFNISVTTQGELYVCCIQFFSRHLIHTLDKFQTVRGTRHQAQVYASSHNIDTIQFQLLDEQGRTLAPLKFRQSDLSNPYNFTLLIETPAQPFRLSAIGRDTNGKEFQRVFPWLVRPLPAAPANTQPENAVAIDNPLPQDWEKGATTGAYKITRAQVLSWSDEPLLSAQGNAIGLRLKFAMRFPTDGAYQPYPQAQPERFGQTGALGLRVYRATVTPAPDGLAATQQLFFGARPLFKGGVVYQFTVDLVPNYAQYQEPKRTFCLQTRGYGQGEMRARFEREVMSQTRLRFRLSITGSDLDGRQPSLTENSYVPNDWYQSYRKEGAAECQ